MKSRIRVWDLPVRLFHWLFASGFIASYMIARFYGEESSLFAFHSMVGLTVALSVILRLVWALIGTRWARFTGLSLDPRDLIAYIRGTVYGNGRDYIGHNPATSFTMLVMFGLFLALVFTGIQSANGGGEGQSEIHGFLANALFAIAAVHVAGVILHLVRHRDGIIQSLVHGRKRGEPKDSIAHSAPFAGAVFCGLLAFLAFNLIRFYDPVAQSTRWPISGSTLYLGESEGGESQASPEGELEND